MPLCPTSQPGLIRALHQMGKGLTEMSAGPCNPGQQGWVVLPCLSHCVPSMGLNESGGLGLLILGSPNVPLDLDLG